MRSACCGVVSLWLAGPGSDYVRRDGTAGGLGCWQELLRPVRHHGATRRARRSARLGLPEGWDGCGLLRHELAGVAVNCGR
jgi:hypothetical protein